MNPKRFFKDMFNLFFFDSPSLFYQLMSGIPISFTNKVVGRARIIKKNKIICLFTKSKNGELIIGTKFKCNNKLKSNSIGLIQPCIFNISTQGSKIIIGNNVGISGSTINATTTIYYRR